MRARPFLYPSLGTLALATWALTAACGCIEHTSRSARVTSVQEDIPILWEKSGTYSRIARRVRIVARDVAMLAQLSLAEIPVDFDTQMVLIAGLGPTPGSDQGIRITRVWKHGSEIRVQERRIHPGADPTPGLRPGSPWTVAVIPKSGLNVKEYTAFVPKDVIGDHPGSR